MQKLKGLEGQGGWIKTAYEHWMEQEGIPIYQSLVGAEDIVELPRRPWARMGGLGTFVEMRGMMEEGNGVYVAEIPGGEALNPEKHLYQEAIFIIQGRGLTEVWQEGGPKTTFEWTDGSVFAPPLNTWHRLINGSREPVIFVAVTTAPCVMSGLYNSEFVFNCEHQFLELFSGQSDYFTATERKGRTKGMYDYRWETNFIPNVRELMLEDSSSNKVHGGVSIGYRMAGNFPVGHSTQWPVGVYHKAHFHGPGAILMGLRGKGYVLMWPKELGPHPYQDGHEDQVVHFNWKQRSIYSPPTEWYHMHLNTSKEPARNLAMYGIHTPRQTPFSAFIGDELSIMTDSKQGGAVIDYEDEDPEIRRRFVEALRQEGIECTMPEVAYRR